MEQVDSAACHNHLTTIKEVCQDLGIPLALEKVEGPSQCLTFLGITLDTERMEARFPSDKLLRIRIRPGRSFVSRMYITAAKLNTYLTTLTSPKTSDPICIGGTPLLPYGMGQVYYMPFSIKPTLIALSRLMRPGHGGVMHSSTLTGFSMLGALNGLQLISWQKNWFPSSLAVLSGPHYWHISKHNFNVITKAWSQPSTKVHQKTEWSCTYSDACGLSQYLLTSILHPPTFQAYIIALLTCLPGIKVKNFWLHISKPPDYLLLFCHPY